MLLVIDAGNTDIVFAIHDGKQWLEDWRIPSKQDPSREIWQYQLMNHLLELELNLTDIQGVVISSVVPSLTEPLQGMSEEITGAPPLVLEPAIFPDLPIKIVNTYEIGSDLVANALAAYTRFGQACIILDFGTALTFTTVSGKGEILGVAIAPGLKTAVQSLFTNTAQLPEVPLKMPGTAIGKNTIQAIQAGVVLGFTGMALYLIDHIRNELQEDCKIIATGGLSSVLTTLHNSIDVVDKRLTLEGLRLVNEYVRPLQS